MIDDGIRIKINVSYQFLSFLLNSTVFDSVFSGSSFKIRILYGVQMRNLLVWWGYFEIEKKEIWHTL